MAFQFPAAPALLETVVNPITGSTYQWRDDLNKWILIRQTTQISEIIWEGDSPPNPVGDYKLWYSTDTLELYFYYCDPNGVCSWVPTSVPIQVLEELNEFAAQAELDIDQLQYKQQLLQVALDDIYLTQQQQQGDYVSKVGGDEMQGPFKVLSNPDIPSSRDARRIETYGVFSGSDTTALRLGTSRDRIYVGHDDTSFNGLVKIDRIAEKNAGNSVQFENDIKMGINQIKNLAEATDDKDAVNYGQVKEELEELRDKILGEVSIGTWKFDNVSSGVTPLAGCFITKKDSNPPQLSPNDINNIRISDEDINGNPGVFDWEIGDLLTFTNVNNTTQSIKFRVNGSPANSGSYWIVSVAHVTSNYDFFQNAEYYLSHINIDASVDVNALDDTYFRLDASNNPITGNLTIDKSANGPSSGGLVGQEASLKLVGDRTGSTNSACTIIFENASSEFPGYLTYRSEKDGNTAFFKFNRDLEIVNTLKTNTISTRSGDITTFDKKLDFTSTSLNARFQKGFVVKKAGESIDGNNIFTVYNDFVEYDGPTNSDKRIANRKWIWDNTVRDYNINSNWGLTAGQYINSSTYGKVNNPGGSLLNKHTYEFLISATGYGSFYVIGNDACVRNDMYVNSLAEQDNPKGKRVATVSTSRSMMSGMREAILGATDFESLKSRLLAKLEEMENSSEFSEDPTTFDIPD